MPVAAFTASTERPALAALAQPFHVAAPAQPALPNLMFIETAWTCAVPATA
jgi:hypothetical protein